jgi:glutaconyl-CoA/methylmalonyl-CoA decarboxylase subunit gamma
MGGYRMKKYTITVNGIRYDVDVEEKQTGDPIQSQPQKIQSVPQEKNKEITLSEDLGSEKIVSPMPGTILKVNVEAGQDVKKGDVLCVLEAMKMETDIVSPRDGKISAILATKGVAVNAGDVLLALL